LHLPLGIRIGLIRMLDIIVIGIGRGIVNFPIKQTWWVEFSSPVSNCMALNLRSEDGANEELCI